MLRPDPSTTSSPDRNGTSNNAGVATNGLSYADATRVGGVDIQRELNKLEELILDSPRIPLSRRTLIDEEQILDQLDLIRVNLPAAFQEATEIVRHKEEIYLEAEQYAQEIVESAERRAAQILDEMGLIRHAELEVKQIRQRVQQECEAAQEQTMADIERMRRQAQQELEEMHQQAIAECEEIQAGADNYADRVLRDMEQQLAEMIRVIRNGRQQLQPDPLPSPKASDASAASRAATPNRPPERPKK
jgi:F0F1-type ATP synthase membrane subunit b/b'